MVERAEAGPKERALLVDLLRCPSCLAGMTVADDRVVCRSGTHGFPVVDGVLLLIEDEALAHDPQYDHQRRYFDDEFTRYSDYRPDSWRVSYLQRLQAGKVLGGPDAPLIDIGVGGSGHTVIEAARAGSPAVGCDLSLEGLVVHGDSRLPRASKTGRSGCAVRQRTFRSRPPRFAQRWRLQ
jgi:uncharacterized protein YbaR (Trm112 family)